MSQKTLQRILFVCRWLPISLCLLFILLVLIRIPAVGEQEKTQKTIAQIKSQHITIGDVYGDNAPLPPEEAQNSVTIIGVDINGNGIRDDVELSLSSSNPNLKVRAGELQYAHTLQLYLTSVFNKETWRAASIQEDRAFQCLGRAFRETGVSEEELFPKMEERVAYIKGLVFDTKIRKDVYEKAMNFITSFGLEDHRVCDVDLSAL